MKLLAAQQVKLGFIGLGNILKTAAREKVPMPAAEAAYRVNADEFGPGDGKVLGCPAPSGRSHGPRGHSLDPMTGGCRGQDKFLIFS